MAKIEFYRDEHKYIESEFILNAYSKIYAELRAAVETKSILEMDDGVKFDLELVFVDLLEGLGLLSYNNLSKVIGRGKAVKAWRRLSGNVFK